MSVSPNVENLGSSSSDRSNPNYDQRPKNPGRMQTIISCPGSRAMRGREQAHQGTYKGEAACATRERTSNNNLNRFTLSRAQGASHVMISRIEQKITL